MFHDRRARWPPLPSTAERDAISQVLRSRRWTAGQWTEEVEARIQEFTGATAAVAFNSCAAGLQAALYATGCRSDSTVEAPSLTFAGTVTGAAHLGADIEFADVNPNELTLTRDGKADHVIAVDLHGVPHRLPRTSTRVITDASHSFGATIGGVPIGRQGTHCFSFTASMQLAASDGGVVTTNDTEVAQRLRQVRDYGMSDEDPYLNLTDGQRPVTWRGGHRWRPTEISMAMVAHRFKLFPITVQWAQRAALRVHEACDRSGIWHQHAPPNTQPTWHRLRIGHPTGEAHQTDRLEAELNLAGIPTHRWGYPLHRMPAYASDTAPPLPSTDAVAGATFCLGTESIPPLTWSVAELDYVCLRLENLTV